MPIYEYRCEKGHTFEVMQRMTDDPLTECEVCGAPVQRVFHPVAVHFKGSGFYTTDYGKKKSVAAERQAGQRLRLGLGVQERDEVGLQVTRRSPSPRPAAAAPTPELVLEIARRDRSGLERALRRARPAWPSAPGRRPRTSRTARAGGSSPRRRSPRARRRSAWFDAGVANSSPPANGRQSATSTRRWAGESSTSSSSPVTAIVSLDRPERRAEHDRRVAEAQQVAVGQPLALAQPLAVDERAVARQPVVDQVPVAPPSRSSWACAPETLPSQASSISQPGARPTVSRSAAPARRTIRCASSPSR